MKLLIEKNICFLAEREEERERERDRAECDTICR